MLKRYLEGLTSYAESVCDTFSDSIEKRMNSEAVIRCFARYFEYSLDRSHEPKPLKRRFVTLACPGRSYDQKEIYDWTCFRYHGPIEYGYSDQYIYCDCGRSLYKNYEFKCRGKDRRPDFSQYEPGILFSYLNNLPLSGNLNILTLGETGVEKSTFINVFVNYLTFDTLDESIRAETLNWLYPALSQPKS
jgi:hypothetical protein